MAETTPEFKQQLREAWAAVQVGQTFTYRRTFTDGDVSLFCGVTGDFNPYHMDDTFAKGSWYGRRNIPGLLTASMMTHIGGMVAMLAIEMEFKFLAPVYVGDTITCTVTIEEKDETKRRLKAKVVYINQAGLEVIRAGFSGFPGDMRLAK